MSVLDDGRRARRGGGRCFALAVGLDTSGQPWPGRINWTVAGALARGFMRDETLLLILDEPTAALDAETEHALFERYAAAVRTGESGRITILVSHRFSTVRMADLIVVLDGARVVEVGSHDALIARGKQYAELSASAWRIDRARITSS
jgi:ATP-binding cassette subfamily B protein